MNKMLCIVMCHLVTWSYCQVAPSITAAKGQYSCGYRTFLALDPSRPAIAEQDLSGHENKTFSQLSGRQVKINVWYPTVPIAGKQPLKFKEYIWEMSNDIDYNPINNKLKAEALIAFADYFREFAGNSSIKIEDLSPLLNYSTGAIRDAPPAAGKFPLILFPCWRSPTAESFLAELLASHGFIVASTSLKGTFSNVPEISVRGVTSAALDLSFVMGEMKKLPFVDASKIAAMGTGINATSCLVFLSAHPEIKSYISLDGGILSFNEMAFLLQTPYFDSSELHIPMLFIYSPHPNISPMMTTEFKYCQRYFVQFPTMSEYYYLNYGVFEGMITGIIGKPPGDVVLGHQWSSQTVLSFIKMTLTGEPANSFISLLQVIPQSLSVSHETMAPVTAVPSLYDLKKSFSGEEFIKWYHQIKISNPKPYSTRLLTDFFNWLSFRRDENFLKREALLKVWMESMPESCRGYFMTARLATIRKDTATAKLNYKKTLELLESDQDIFLDNVTRQRIKSLASQFLNSN